MRKPLLKAAIAAGVMLLAAPVCATAAAQAKEVDTLKHEASGDQAEVKAQGRNEAVMERLEKEEDKQSVGEYLDDAGITAKVKGEFVGQKGLDSLDIKVVTVEGAVTLMGEVDTQAQIELAGRVAQEVKGVKKVDNKLTLKK